MNKFVLKYCIALLIGIVSISIFSCNEDDEDTSVRKEVITYTVAKPTVMTRDRFREIAPDIIAPQDFKTPGKIYAYKDYVFVNDKGAGIHLIDNTDPANPTKKAYVEIFGNEDIAIKDDLLYADSLMDMVVLDISDIENIKFVNRLEDVVPYDFWAWPVVDVPFDTVAWPAVESLENVVVGWEFEEVREEIAIAQEGGANDGAVIDFASDAAAPSGDTGQGGSLARFKIVGDYLYTVDDYNLNVFDITNGDQPEIKDTQNVGFGIETIFGLGQNLFIGSTRGMFIYDISNPSKPEFLSAYEHFESCDPVVVDGDYAYVTLRAGNLCGAGVSQLQVLDISDLKSPKLELTKVLEEPYGLGVAEDLLFVCDGSSGLKVFDKSKAPDVVLVAAFEEVFAFDVIPLEKSLLMIGEGILYQYEYKENSIVLLSSFEVVSETSDSLD